MGDKIYKESFKPPPNLPPARGVVGFLRSLVVRVLDLQVHSVITHLSPWLRSRQGSVLEVGCGSQPYRHFLPAHCSYRGLDWALASQVFDAHARDVEFFDGGLFPFEDGEFESVFHTEVLEHVPDPLAFLKECRRVLKPEGAFFFTVPFQARVHYIPHDYWRFTPYGIALLLEKAGFTDIEIKHRGTDVTVAAYKTLGVTFRLLRGDWPSKCLGVLSLPLAFAALFCAHLSLAGELGSPDDCLGFVVTAKGS